MVLHFVPATVMPMSLECNRVVLFELVKWGQKTHKGTYCAIIVILIALIVP